MGNAVLQQDPMTFFDAMGVEGIEEFFELLMMFIVVSFFIFVALQFAKRSRKKEGFEVQKKLSLGYCFYFLSMAISYAAYLLDRTWRFLFGPDERFFARRPDSILSFDYFLVMFFGMSLGFAFLSYVIEKHVLNRRVVLAWVCLFAVIFTIALRPLEDAVMPFSPDVAKYLGIVLFAAVAMVIVMLVVIYIKIASMSPAGSELWNRSIAFIIGTSIMVVIMVVGVRQFSIFPTFGPIIALASLFIMNYGLSRSE